MNPSPLSLWEQTQLTLLRFLSIVLGLLDRIFHIHWGEHLLDRMSNRWQKRLDQLGKGLAWAALGLVVIVFLTGLLQSSDIKQLFLASISIAVAAVPATPLTYGVTLVTPLT